jgi:serine/threonine protein kinase
MERADSNLLDYLNLMNKELEILPKDFAIAMISLSKKISLQICKGLKYLHDLEIAHRDLKPENVLVFKNESDVIVKIADFDLLRFTNSTTKSTTSASTPRWAPPEALFPERFGMQGSRQDSISTDTRLIKGDIYSLGYLLYFIWKRKVPFEGVEGHPIVGKVLELVINKQLPLSISDIPYEKVIEKCWNLSIDDRPTIDWILKEIQELK